MKKLRKVKMQLSQESGNVRSPSPDSGKHVWLNSAKIAGFQSDSSGFGWIPAILAKFGRISGQIHPNPAGSMAGLSKSGWIPAILARSGSLAGFRLVSTQIWSAGIRRRWLDVAEFRRRQYSSGRMSPDSDAAWIPTTDHCRIPAIGYQT
jgi:hypothetical protein